MPKASADRSRFLLPACSIVHTGRLRRIPWKNGAGTTRELAILTDTEDSADIWWRLSMADIVEDAPFSRFFGLDRHLLVASSGSVAMDVDGISRTADYGQPEVFRGEAEVSVRLATGATTVINLFTKRGLCAGTIDVRHIHGLHIPRPDTVALVLLAGSAAAHGCQRLEPLDTLIGGTEAQGLFFDKAFVATVRVWADASEAPSPGGSAAATYAQ